MKICTKCKIEKPYTEFRKASRYKDGYNYHCKECVSGHKIHKKILEGSKICITCNIEKPIEMFSSTFSKGLEYKQSSCKKCRNKMKDLKLKGTDKLKIKTKRISYKSKLKSKYGITIDIYNEMLKSQNNVCKICNNPESKLDSLGNIQRLSVDHCHTTLKVRGLLCSGCNTSLGGFKDNIETLESAIKYLKENNC